MKQDYKRKYKLEDIGIEVIDGPLWQAVDQTMSQSTPLGSYCVRKKNTRDLVMFGRTAPIQMRSNNALLITGPKRFHGDIPTVVLRYGVYPEQIVVGYIQTPDKVGFGDYLRVKSDLEERPHDLIFAHFLDRISPILDKFPNTNMYFSPIYLNKPVYPFLRDRFLDSDYFLNPRRERVEQILGEQNSWLREDNIKARSSTKQQLKEMMLTESVFFDLLV